MDSRGGADSYVSALTPAQHSTAGDIMTTPAITISPDTPAQHAAQTLTQNRIGAAPVVNADGVLLGMVSEYDLLAKTGETVRDVMTTAVVTATADCAVEDIRHLLVNRRVRRVPIMREGRLAGIVSRHDVLALLATEWVCRVCGEPVRGERPPDLCPRCHATSERFELQEQPPGA